MAQHLQIVIAAAICVAAIAWCIWRIFFKKGGGCACGCGDGNSSCNCGCGGKGDCQCGSKCKLCR